MIENFYKDLLEYNNPRFQYIKLAEELNELAAVLLKKCNKKPEHQPDLSHLIEELGDVRLRTNALIIQEGIEKQVEARSVYKASQLLEWKSEGKYKGGL